MHWIIGVAVNFFDLFVTTNTRTDKKNSFQIKGVESVADVINYNKVIYIHTYIRYLFC